MAFVSLTEWEEYLNIMDNIRKYYDQQPSHRTYAVPKTTRSLKVVHLCTEDFGGAGKAAYRLHKALQQAGVNSSMLVLNKKSNDLSVKVLPQDYTTDYNPVYMKQYEKWQKLLAQFPAKSPEFVFTDVVSDIKLDCVEEIHNADIVNLHWVAGMLNYPNLPFKFSIMFKR
ncbi:unnamed protein product [marine sediment metagenome]|uniref:Glycosyltransferase subfamily 4-like N-terminal domain-containing protein n=1 Tax=marine sediment metagenome TaxID=412755 RepID=X0U9W0_9ZZZZ